MSISWLCEMKSYNVKNTLNIARHLLLVIIVTVFNKTIIS